MHHAPHAPFAPTKKHARSAAVCTFHDTIALAYSVSTYYLIPKRGGPQFCIIANPTALFLRPELLSIHTLTPGAILTSYFRFFFPEKYSNTKQRGSGSVWEVRGQVHQHNTPYCAREKTTNKQHPVPDAPSVVSPCRAKERTASFIPFPHAGNGSSNVHKTTPLHTSCGHHYLKISTCAMIAVNGRSICGAKYQQTRSFATYSRTTSSNKKQYINNRGHHAAVNHRSGARACPEANWPGRVFMSRRGTKTKGAMGLPAVLAPVADQIRAQCFDVVLDRSPCHKVRKR